MKHIIATTVLALTGFALAGTSASAQTITYNAGDLVLGFQITDSSNIGYHNNLMVDLGAASTYTGVAAGTILNLNVGGSLGTGGLSVSDLSATYGNSWNSSSLAWTVYGAKSVTTNETYLSTTGSSLTTPASYATVASNIRSSSSAFGSATPTANSTSGTVISDSTNGSFTGAIEGAPGSGAIANYNPGNDFGSGYSVLQTVSSSGSTSLELFDLKKNNGTVGVLVGTFNLSSAGVLTFDAPAVVPEPSSYALMILAGAALAFMRFRQKRMAA